MFHSTARYFNQSAQPFPDRQLSLGRRIMENGVIAPWQLFFAMGALERWDSCLTDILIAKGWVNEAQMQPYLSQHYRTQVIDLRQAPPDFRLIHKLSPTFCLKHSIVPWISENGILVYAMSRPHVFTSLAKHLPAGPNGVGFVLAREQDIQSYVTRVFQSALVQVAETRVPLRESCRNWSGQTQRRAAILVLLFVPLVLGCLIWPSGTLVAIGVATLTSQILAASMKLAAFAASQRVETTRLMPTKKLPRISVLVPLYKETEIAAALLRRLGALTYPKALLEVVLVLEENDWQTKQALRSGKIASWMRVIEVPAGSGLTTKPRAMNYALDFCKGEIIGIWDAEDAPAPDQLEVVAAHIASAAPEVACWQGILDYYNPKTNWLSRCFTLEYSMWFRTVIRGMSRLGAAVPLGGTTLYVRRSALENVGGWDAHNVTEDADLGIRLYRHGYRTKLIQTVTQEEANCRLVPWIKQRSRWLKGYMITYLVHMRQPKALIKELGWRSFTGFNLIFLSTLSQFLLAPFVWSFWLLAFGMSLNWVTALPVPIIGWVTLLFIGITVMDMTLAVVSLRGQNRKWLAGWAISLPIYFALATFGAYKALYELITMPFYWDKTAHGQTSEGLDADYSAVGDQPEPRFKGTRNM